MLIHRFAGFKLLLRMMAKRLGHEHVRGFPAAKTTAERGDPALSFLLGAPHDVNAGCGACRCALCSFNRGGEGAPRVMVADAKECGEGISFLGVRRLLLADVPCSADECMQRIGRAVRFMGHASLPQAERHVEMRLYVATSKVHPPCAPPTMVLLCCSAPRQSWCFCAAVYSLVPCGPTVNSPRRRLRAHQRTATSPQNLHPLS